MEQYADEFERQCAVLRGRIATEENKTRHLEAERDARNGRLVEYVLWRSKQSTEVKP